MHFITITSAVLAALASTATAVPTKSSEKNSHGFAPLDRTLNISPGIHEYSIDEDGNVNITKIADLDLTPLNKDRLTSRQTTTDTWQGCENYGLTSSELYAESGAWTALTNWASGPGGYSPWVSSYIAMSSTDAYAYMCQWGNGNHISSVEVNQAKGSIAAYCTGGAGMLQWNSWKKGIGMAAKGFNWCNGQSGI